MKVARITTAELTKIKQKLCPHDSVQQTSNIFDWECSDCGKPFFIAEVVTEANRRLRRLEEEKNGRTI